MRRSALAVGVVAVTLVGCGGDSASDPRPLSRDQATVMADLLYRNYESGGADFTLSTVAGPGGGTITVSGEVDWTHHRGHASVNSSAPGTAPVTEVWWNEQAVFERRPALDEKLFAEGLALSPAVIGRPVDIDHRRMDQLIAILVGLAATQPDNAELIAQAEGSAFLRDDMLRGVNIEVLRYGERTIYWVDKVTGEMVRFEGSDESGQYPVVIDIFDRGEREITSDPNLTMLDISEVPEMIVDQMSTSP